MVGESLCCEHRVSFLQSQKWRREDVKVHVAEVYRMAAENVWPGILIRRPVLRMHFLKFIEETVRQVQRDRSKTFKIFSPCVMHWLACCNPLQLIW